MAAPVETPPELAGGTYESTVRDKAAELKRELIKQTLDDAESWRKAVDVEYAQAHPEVEQPYSPIPPEEIQGYRNEVENEYYEWVIPAFERYLEPDPDAINPMISQLRQIESMFEGSQDDAGSNYRPASGSLGRINDVRTEMGFWEGTFRNDFIDNFLTPLQSVSLNMGSMAKLIREQLECTKVIYIRYRKAVVKLLDQSIEAVKTLNNGRDPESHMWGTLIGISVGTALTLASGGVAAAGAVMIIGSTMAQGVAPDPPKTNELSAPTAQEVAMNISDAMVKLDNDTLTEEHKAEDAFDNIFSTLSNRQKGKAGDFTVQDPDLSAATGQELEDGYMRPKD